MCVCARARVRVCVRVRVLACTRAFRDTLCSRATQSSLGAFIVQHLRAQDLEQHELRTSLCKHLTRS